ncbi:hypothetical protein MKQ70_10310 [Chitinophaga sedimenti]|uniref:hypothetical protein n=1 Tax=Chitinophaga sedimenti TaxID=2033606 RepID=UPI002005077F|nr:hypothetical protein [Chitinophaga sedimenti]MCK7555374.1 hypothetical protein [Chitinophaga sedimenti]
MFDEQYKIVFERTARFTETTDEDGDPCENLESLRLSVFDSLREVFKRKDIEVKAINFSTYGASLVYIDEDGRPLTPLYNYLKAYPAALKEQFYNTYGEKPAFLPKRLRRCWTALIPACSCTALSTNGPHCANPSSMHCTCPSI